MALTYNLGQSLWSYSNTTDNSNASTAQFADFDGDGDLDIYIGVEKAAGNQPSQVWTNDGSGNFSLHYTFPATRVAQSWLVNLDGDAAPELITRDLDRSLRIYQNDGTGAFTSSATVGAGNVQTADVADIDGDGDLDIVIGTFQGNYSVYKNNGSGGFTLTSSPAKVSDPLSLTLVDLDKDGDKDILTVEENSIRILTNDGTGAFTAQSSFGDVYGGIARAADLTGDGYADAMVSGMNGPSANLISYRNDGSGTIGTQLQVFSSAEAPSSFADLDGDGDLDGLAQKLMLNNGSGLLSDSGVLLRDPAILYNGSPVDGRALAAGDVDGDGDLDLAVAFYTMDWNTSPYTYSGTVKIFINDSAPPTNADGTIAAGASVTEPVGLPSTADTAGEAIDVFDFRLTDGGGGDGVALGLSQLKVHTSGTGDFSKVTWRLSGPDATNVVGTYNSGTNEITFNGLSISVADGGNETYKISAYYNDRSGLADGQTYILSIDGDTDVTLATGSTRMASSQAAVTNGTGSVVSVVNEAPSNISLSANSVAENTPTPSPLTIGTLSTTDPNIGDSFTYSISGGADASDFVIAGSNLQFKAGTVLDYEAKSSYAVTVRSTDGGGLFTDKSFAVSLTNVNEAPLVANPIPDQTASATQSFNFAFASDAFEDPDASTTLSYTASLDNGNPLPAWLTFSPGTRTFSGTPAAGDAGNLQIRVTASDGSLSTTDTFSLVVTAGPTATIVVVDSALTVDETSAVTITFSEAVAGFDNSDLTVANGTLSTVSSSDGGVTWTATLTPTAGITDATNVITANMAGVTSVSSNVAGVGTTSSNNYAIDTARPTATVVVADTDLAIGETSGVTITFSEAVTGFSLADLTAENGVLSGLSTSDNITYTATFTPNAGITDTTNLITLDNTGVIDTAGNAGTGTTDSNNYAIDSQRPTATVVVSDAALTAGETSLVTITFSEAVTGFDNTDLTVANGTLSAVSSADGGITWTATLTPTASMADATNVITLDNTGVADLAGNAGTGTTDSNNYTVNTLRPTASIVVADTALAVGETSAVTITFSEAVTGFDNSDLTVANGTLSAVSSSDGGITWTATLTPTAGITDATNLITLDNTGVTNAGGNTGTGTTDSNNYAIDTQRPTATLVVADTALAIGETSGVTITFSEAVTGFSAADLTAANGTLSNLSTSDNITYTATFTPSAGITDTTNLITLDNTGVADAAGNAGTGTTDSNNYVVDTLAPALASATVNGSQLVLTYTESTTLDATNAPTTTDFAVAVGATANTVTAVAVNAAAKTVTLTLTTAVLTGQSVTVAYTDPTAGNDNNAIQDAAGNDAASFAATSAINLTPAIPDPDPEPTPPTPVPPTPPTPGVPDNDGIPPTVEDQVPGIPGPGGNTTPGDGNGDGIKDSEQPSVGSIGFVLSPTGESNPGNAPPTFTTLVASSQDGKVGSGNDNARITSLTQKDAPTDLPAGMQMPIGLVSFTVELGQGKTGENFSLYVDPALGVNGYWKENASGQWVNIASEPYGGKMVMEGGRLRLDFHIEDGGQFDADGKADGIITDPGAPGHMALSVVGMAPDMPHGFWF